MKRDNAFTGLEAAIVLIAFVVVAAIFSYVMLGAGFFATQKAQEVTYAGVKQTISNLIPSGTIYGTINSDGNLTLIQIGLTVPAGGESVELSDMLLTFAQEGKTPKNIIFNEYDTTGIADPDEWTFNIKECTAAIVPSTNDSVLVSPGNSCSAIMLIENGPIAGQWFSIEIKPPVGAPTTIRKIIPTGYKGGKLL